MPGVSGGYTLTFSKKNYDVRYILEKEKEKGTIITNYICDAIRFYANRNTVNVAEADIENIIIEKINEILQSNNECIVKEEHKKSYDLEDFSFIDESDLEED